MPSDTIEIKLLFDECFGEPIARALVHLLEYDKKHRVEARYMKSWIAAGVPDDEWVPQAKEENRFVITGDRGRKRIGAPLHLLLPRHGVSGAFMTSGMYQRPQCDKARSIISLWPKIIEAATASPGTRYRIKIGGKSRESITSFSWSEWPLQEKDEDDIRELDGGFPERLPFNSRDRHR